MNINSAFSSGVYGVQKAFNSLDQHASTIARSSMNTESSAEGESQTDALIGLKAAELQGKASAKVIDTTDAMIGSLLDIRV